MADPFVVRAHHTYQLWRMEYLGYTPETLSQNVKDSVSSLPSRMLKPGYNKDVYGDTPEQNATALDGITKYLRDFKNLEPDNSVQFTATEKDGICGSCVVGSHCDTFRPNFDGDAQWVTGLHKTAAELGLAADVQLGKTVVKSLFAKEIITSLTTDAQTAKKLVGDRLLPVRAVGIPVVDAPLAMLRLKLQEHRSRK